MRERERERRRTHLQPLPGDERLDTGDDAEVRVALRVLARTELAAELLVFSGG